MMKENITIQTRSSATCEGKVSTRSQEERLTLHIREIQTSLNPLYLFYSHTPTQPLNQLPYPNPCPHPNPKPTPTPTPTPMLV